MRAEWRSYRSRVASAGSGRGRAWREIGATALKRSHCGSDLTFVQGLEGVPRAPCGRKAPAAWGRSMQKRGRPSEIEALAVGDSQGAQEGEILVARDALGDDRGADSFGETDERGGKSLAGGVARDLLRQAEIELHDVGRQPEDVPQVGEAGSNVVDRNLRAALAKRSKRSAQFLVVVDLSVLRDFDHDAVGH